MHTRITLLASTVVLMMGVLGASRPVAAAPPQPYHYDDCVTYVLDSALYEYCYEFQGTVQTTDSPSGVTTHSDRGTLSETLTLSGEVVESNVETYTYMGVSRDGEPQVNREAGRGSTSALDPITGEEVTCTYDFHAIITNSFLRREVSNFECR